VVIPASVAVFVSVTTLTWRRRFRLARK
jgi:hypothetical protein